MILEIGLGQDYSNPIFFICVDLYLFVNIS